MDTSIVENPFPHFKWLGEKGPVYRLPFHHDVAVLGDEEAAGQDISRDKCRMDIGAKLTPHRTFGTAQDGDANE